MHSLLVVDYGVFWIGITIRRLPGGARFSPAPSYAPQHCVLFSGWSLSIGSDRWTRSFKV